MLSRFLRGKKIQILTILGPHFNINQCAHTHFIALSFSELG